KRNGEKMKLCLMLGLKKTHCVSDGNQCQSHMCVHGSCVDLYQAYACHCEPGYEGRYCEQPQTATNCSVDNGGCDHDCTESEDGPTRRCHCLNGYKLADDHRKCIPKGESAPGRRRRPKTTIKIRPQSSYTKPMDGLLPWMVGGEVGKKGESPWQVRNLTLQGRFHCGGVLIDESWVLTAAHCLDNNLRLMVKAFKHPDYNKLTVDNDIALLRLETPAPLSDYIVPVCLPGRSMAERVLHLNGTMTVVSGWGSEDLNTAQFSSALNVIKVPLVSHGVCSRQMHPFNITHNVVCAGILGQRTDACEGDSGGPMVTLYRDTWFLVGLVSWGDGCGKADKLGIYTKVSNYNDWINTQPLGAVVVRSPVPVVAATPKPGGGHRK
uniref:Vitamin K-dependent protein C n=1 Tax=Salarias fasciatus TaxID=181472 RepID=A0A672G035_SALFA